MKKKVRKIPEQKTDWELEGVKKKNTNDVEYVIVERQREENAIQEGNGKKAMDVNGSYWTEKQLVVKVKEQNKVK